MHTPPVIVYSIWKLKIPSEKFIESWTSSFPPFPFPHNTILIGARESRHHIKGTIGIVKRKPKKSDVWEHTLFQIQLWSSFLYILIPMNKNDRNLGKCHLGTDNSPAMTNSEHCGTAHLQTKQNQDLSSLCRYKNLNFSKKWAGNLLSAQNNHLSLLSCPAYKTGNFSWTLSQSKAEICHQNQTYKPSTRCSDASWRKSTKLLFKYVLFNPY